MPNTPHPPSRRPPASPKSGAPSPAEVERALALRDVMDHAVRVKKEVSGATPIRSWRGGAVLALLLCVPLLGFSAYSFIVRPEFIWGPAPAQSPAVQEANYRMGLYLMAQRVERYRAESGHLPATLADAGLDGTGIEFQPLPDGQFELRTTPPGARPLVYRSNESAAAFLGNSITVIQSGGK
jgi:hypothetical protein